MVLFDLHHTLEAHDILLPGARETLQAIRAMRDHDGYPVALALVSDFYMPSHPEDIAAIEQRYLAILDQLGIRPFFEPTAERVTLSTTVGVFKPDPRLFEAVIERSRLELTFSDLFFITENREHVEAARGLGIRALQYRGPGQLTGEVDALLDVTRPIEEFFQIPTARALLRSARSMGMARSQVPSEAQRAWSDPTGAMMASWVRFGDEVLLMTDRDWDSVVEDAGRQIEEIEDLPTLSRRDQLHLVVQKGRLFQQAHPEVKIVLDRGRFLVVDVAPEQAHDLNQHDVSCYAIEPLEDNQVVFTEGSGEGRRGAPVAWIQALVDRVSRDTLEADLTHLTEFPTRASTTTHYAEAAAWARGQLATDYLTRTERFLVNSTSSLNVIADKRGTRLGLRDVILVVAHLDAINAEDGPESRAPGADDNASGCAGLLALARIFKDYPSVHDLRFILLGGEEQGLYGSRHYLSSLPAAERGRIRAVINLDMIGRRNPEAEATVLLEGAAISRHLLDGLEQAAFSYTSLTVRTSLSPAASDHVPFIDAGIPAVLTIEGADHGNTAVHTARDTPDRIDYELLLDILRMNIAYIATLLAR